MFSYMDRSKVFYRNVAALAVPMILQNLITSSLGMLDTFMVGLLGEAPMAAVTLANIPVFVVMLMTFGLQSGGSVLISQFYGKRDTDSINRVLGIGLYLGGGLTFLFGCVMFFLPRQFMSLFGNDPAVVALAADYARIVAFSFLCDTLASVYVAMHRSMERPKLGTYLFTSAGVANAFLNWVFIFGHLGAPALGVKGAALATALARILELAVALVHAFVSKSFPIKLSLILWPGKEMLSRYIRYATPVLLNETLWGLGNSLFTTVMGHMAGSQAILAAYAISGNIDRLCTVAVMAVSGATGIIIGREIGAGKKDQVYDIGRALDMLAFLVGLTVGVVCIGLTFLLFKPVVYPIFSLSKEAEDIAVLMSVISFAFLALRSFNTTNVVGVLRGGGDVKMASFIDLAPLWFAAVPAAALCGLVLQKGILWVLLSIQLENLVKFFIGLRRLHSGKWVRDVTAE